MDSVDRDPSVLSHTTLVYECGTSLSLKVPEQQQMHTAARQLKLNAILKNQHVVVVGLAEISNSMRLFFISVIHSKLCTKENVEQGTVITIIAICLKQAHT